MIKNGGKALIRYLVSFKEILYIFKLIIPFLKRFADRLLAIRSKVERETTLI